MKKVYILGIMLCACTLFNSCNDEWKEELYREMISFKAPIGSNGVHDIYVRYQPDGSGSFQLPVIVSGSQANTKDIDVKISVDNDTLAILNTEKYLDRRDLWYKQLPEQFYSFHNMILKPCYFLTLHLPQITHMKASKYHVQTPHHQGKVHQVID